jgi:hypothetical protein
MDLQVIRTALKRILLISIADEILRKKYTDIYIL